MSFKIQRADINGDWDDIHKADFIHLSQARLFATEWARKDPKCAWGVRVVDPDGNVVFEP